MNFLQTLKNLFITSDKYTSNSEAVIIACYFNPQNNPYRLIAFNKFYDTIKHLNHRIIECVIGDAISELPTNPSITKIHTKDLLWHKETLLNKIVAELPENFRYVFWLDTDVIFTNKNWLVESVEQLKTTNIVQPFEYCIHLDQDEIKPSFNVDLERKDIASPALKHPKMWRSFCANYVTTDYSGDTNYDKHGHVGFAWGARREILENIPLYDRALIGGADHIIAHAAAGQIGHSCILKSFTDDIDAVNDWSKVFYHFVKGKIGYVKGDLYHIWHGDVAKRQYLKRIQDFTPTSKGITKKDNNGMYITENDETTYVKQYFDHREDTKNVSNIHREPVVKVVKNNIDYKILQRKKTELRRQYPTSDNSFIESMALAYFTDSTFIGSSVGGDVLGAVIGDMLNDNDSQPIEQGFQDGFGGGDFSGGGSGGEWDTPTNDNTDSTDYTSSENFS